MTQAPSTQDATRHATQQATRRETVYTLVAMGVSTQEATRPVWIQFRCVLRRIEICVACCVCGWGLKEATGLHGSIVFVTSINTALPYPKSPVQANFKYS